MAMAPACTYRRAGHGSVRTCSATTSTQPRRTRSPSDGYTIVEDAIEPDARRRARRRPARGSSASFDVEPAGELFEGHQHAAHLQPARARRALRAGAGAPDTCCRSSRACSTRAASISSLSSIAIEPGETAQPIHADDQLIPLAEAARRRPSATRCGRSPTSPRPTARPASSPARTSPTTPPTTAPTTTRSPAEMPTGSVLVWHGSLWHGGGANTHRRAPRRHRDELLRRLHPPAGEPAARPPARHRAHASRPGCASSSATASTTGSSATSTSTARSRCSTRSPGSAPHGLGRLTAVHEGIHGSARSSPRSRQPRDRGREVRRRSLITGSASMLAESIHSVADTGNQGLLFLGGKRGRRRPTDGAPVRLRRRALLLGVRRRARAVHPRRAVRALRGHREAHAPARAREPAVGVRRARRRDRARGAVAAHRVPARPTAPAGRRSWWQFIRRTKSPELPVVLLEDTGALVGLVFALVGIGLAEITGDRRWDAIGSIAIGLLLGVDRGRARGRDEEPAHRRSGDRREDGDAIRAAIARRRPRCRAVIHLRTLQLGPDELLVAAKLDFDAATTRRARRRDRRGRGPDPRRVRGPPIAGPASPTSSSDGWRPLRDLGPGSQERWQESVSRLRSRRARRCRSGGRGDAHRRSSASSSGAMPTTLPTTRGPSSSSTTTIA